MRLFGWFRRKPQKTMSGVTTTVVPYSRSYQELSGVYDVHAGARPDRGSIARPGDYVSPDGNYRQHHSSGPGFGTGLMGGYLLREMMEPSAPQTIVSPAVTTTPDATGYSGDSNANIDPTAIPTYMETTAPSVDTPSYEIPAPTFSEPSYDPPSAPSYESPSAPSYEAPSYDSGSSSSYDSGSSSSFDSGSSGGFDSGGGGDSGGGW